MISTANSKAGLQHATKSVTQLLRQKQRPQFFASRDDAPRKKGQTFIIRAEIWGHVCDTEKNSSLLTGYWGKK